MSFAENFKKARKEAGLTQKQVADALGLNRSTVTYYETGVSMPNTRNLGKIRDLLNISIEDLLK
ncbi:MAG: helix-turn-helix domain-containing protein [Clostridia bacterium]|nr:helix-turn-helix domain-containing protein [Clostridia bacterium]